MKKELLALQKRLLRYAPDSDLALGFKPHVEFDKFENIIRNITHAGDLICLLLPDICKFCKKVNPPDTLLPEGYECRTCSNIAELRTFKKNWEGK